MEEERARKVEIFFRFSLLLFTDSGCKKQFFKEHVEYTFLDRRILL